MSRKTDTLFDISISERKVFMTKEEKYEELITRFIERKKLSVSEIQKKGKVGVQIAMKVYKEWKNYHDEVYWHNAIYEISFMDDIPTPIRIMDEFDISYYFAKKLFDYYMEVI